MRRNLFPVFALLLGTFFLFLGHGLNGLLLPLRGTLEGYSTNALGLLGTSWAGGFVLGCLLAPRLVRHVGHVRAFSGLISLAAIIALLMGIVVDDTAWLLLRALTGFATAGTSMIIESWLNERANNESRGMIFSFYMLITLTGAVGGQMLDSAGRSRHADPVHGRRHRLLHRHAADDTVECGIAQTAAGRQPRPCLALSQFAGLLRRHPADRNGQWRLRHDGGGVRRESRPVIGQHRPDDDDCHSRRCGDADPGRPNVGPDRPALCAGASWPALPGLPVSRSS